MDRSEDKDFDKLMAEEGVIPGPKDVHRTATTPSANINDFSPPPIIPEEEPQHHPWDELDDRFLVSSDHQFQWHKDGTQVLVVKKLQQGNYPPEDTVDLHGKRIYETGELVRQFIEKSIGDRMRTISIIHGRGAKSEPPAQLKSFIGQILPQHPDVLAFCTAPSWMGGTGATLVWLRKSKEDKVETRERISKRLG